MSRPRNTPGEPVKLNHQKSEIIHENFLKEDPEMLPKVENPTDKLLVVNTLPTYRKVVFVNGRDPGCPLDFHYHSKTHYLKHYLLHDGHEVTLPEELIEHLESRCIPQYAYRKRPDGSAELYTKSYTYLYQCRPVSQHRKMMAA